MSEYFGDYPENSNYIQTFNQIYTTQNGINSWVGNTSITAGQFPGQNDYNSWAESNQTTDQYLEQRQIPEQYLNPNAVPTQYPDQYLGHNTPPVQYMGQNLGYYTGQQNKPGYYTAQKIIPGQYAGESVFQTQPQTQNLISRKYMGQNISPNHLPQHKDIITVKCTDSKSSKLQLTSELSSRYQGYTRKESVSSKSGGRGMALLQKMGWNPGEGLGKHKEGTLVPLLLEMKRGRKGLESDQDLRTKLIKFKQKPKAPIPTIKTLEGKHPVSLLGEYCTKRKFEAPQYVLFSESGPDHQKNFIYKVKVNGVEYKSSNTKPNKKLAKAEAAQVCLQTLGLLQS